MKGFTEYLNESISLNESKAPFSFIIKLNYPAMPSFEFGKKLESFSKRKFGELTTVKTDIISVKEDKSGNFKHQFSIVPEDKSLLTKQNISDLVKFFSDTLSYNFSDKSMKVTIAKADSSLVNILPGTGNEKAYKTLFGTKAPKVGQKISVSAGTGKTIFEVVHIVSNDIVVCNVYTMQGSYRSRFSSHWVFVKGKGAWDEKQAPSEYKKYF